MEVVRIECAIKNYHWGKFGCDSKVAQFAKSNVQEFTVEEGKPYAELWMGTLPTGPSVIKSSGMLLSDYISKNPACLGSTILDQFQEQLPFLFKVLSVNKSLSIQAHPNKKHAEELNRKCPEKYGDPNHKPEMALALTDFEGMCGFRPFSQFQAFVRGVEELSAVIGEDAVKKVNDTQLADLEGVKSAIKQSFTCLMRCESSRIEEQITKLVGRLADVSTDIPCIDDSLRELILRLNEQFPGDVGIFSAFFLNHMKLKPGEAMFLAANLPHAYLSGDCIECMAKSDNVVRAGLTPKFKDVDTLVEMLDYTPKAMEENIMSYTQGEDDSNVKVFQPLVPDFAVHSIQIPAHQLYNLTTENSASIVIVTAGEGQIPSLGEINAGHTIFIPAREGVSIQTSSDMTLYRALCLPQI